MSSDAEIRVRARGFALEGGVEGRSRALVDRLRLEPRCGQCGGSGRWSPDRPTDPRSLWAGVVVRACWACAGTGQVLAARLRLAGLLGDEAAILVLGGVRCGTCGAAWWRSMGPHTVCPACPFEAWCLHLADLDELGPAPGWVRARAAWIAATVALERFPWLALPPVGLGEQVETLRVDERAWNRHALRAAAAVSGEETVRAAIERDLVAWALA